MDCKKYGIWSRISQRWEVTGDGRIISYDTRGEALAHVKSNPLAHTERAEWVAAGIKDDGSPALDPEDAVPVDWSLKRSHEAPF